VKFYLISLYKICVVFFSGLAPSEKNAAGRKILCHAACQLFSKC